MTLLCSAGFKGAFPDHSRVRYSDINPSQQNLLRYGSLKSFKMPMSVPFSDIGLIGNCGRKSWLRRVKASIFIDFQVHNLHIRVYYDDFPCISFTLTPQLRDFCETHPHPRPWKKASPRGALCAFVEIYYPASQYPLQPRCLKAHPLPFLHYQSCFLVWR